MEMSPAQTIATKIDKDYVYVTLTAPQVKGRVYDVYTISQQIANHVLSLRPCDMDSLLQPNNAVWTEYTDNVGCKTIWEGKFLLGDLVKCGMDVFNPTDPTDPIVKHFQRINFTVFSKVTDQFLFGWSPVLEEREVFRSYDVEIILENFVTGSISFNLYAPPEVLNAIIRERYDVNRQVYEIDVIKLVQAHFEIEAISVVYPSGYNVQLITGSTDRLEIETAPPCSIPGHFRINYKIKCHDMTCRDNTWNDAYVEFDIPEDEMCPSVSRTYSPSMVLNLCADAACSAYTSDHILNYIATVEAKVSMAAPILLTRFYDVVFTKPGTPLSSIAKDAYTVTTFGNEISYVDNDGGADGKSTFDFIPKDGAFFNTPDIHTSAQYGLKVVMYVEADLTQTVKKAFLVSADVEPTARSFAMAKSAVKFASDGAASGNEEDSSKMSAGLIVAIVVGALVVISAFSVFVVRRRSALRKTEHHVNMEPVTTA
jgi:hypothetical protein